MAKPKPPRADANLGRHRPSATKVSPAHYRPPDGLRARDRLAQIFVMMGLVGGFVWLAVNDPEGPPARSSTINMSEIVGVVGLGLLFCALLLYVPEGIQRALRAYRNHRKLRRIVPDALGVEDIVRIRARVNRRSKRCTYSIRAGRSRSTTESTTVAELATTIWRKLGGDAPLTFVHEPGYEHDVQKRIPSVEKASDNSASNARPRWTPCSTR